MCLTFFSKSEPTEIINFINTPTKKSKQFLDKFNDYSNPEIEYNFEVENLTVKTDLLVRRSFEDVDKKIQELASQNLTENDKKYLELLKEEVGKKKEEISKSDEYEINFKMHATQRFFSEKSVVLKEMKIFLLNNKSKKLFDVVQKFFPQPFHISVCPTYQFSASKYRPVGGFALPSEIPLPSVLKAKFGSTELVGYELRFKDSIAGIEALEFRLDKDTLVLELRASYELANLEDMFRVLTR